jgi:homoserine kinase
LLPEFYKVVQTSIEAGAVGGWLSGSGSTTMSLAANQQVAEVILAAWESLGLSGKFQILEPDNTGFQEI